MGKTITKSICWLLCLVLVLSMIPAVFATEADNELFDISGSSMTLGNTLQINFAIDTTKLTGTDNYIVISKEYADDRGSVTKTVQQSDWTYLNETTSYVSYSVSAKEMNDKLTVAVYDAAGQQLTNTYEDSVAAYCLRTLAKEEAKASADAKTLALFVDMLNYGAAAQTEWSYNTEALADASLTEAQKGYATPVPEKDNILQEGEGYYGTSLSLKENILMNVAYNASQISDAAYAVVTFVDHYGNDESVTIQKADFVTSGDLQYISIEVMAVADYRQAVTVTLYDAEGNAISTTVDSVESYLSRKTGALYDAIAAFGVGAYNYFHTNSGTGDNTTVITGTVSAEDGTVTEDTSFSDGEIAAQVPAGVQVEGNTLTLTVTEKGSSDSGVALEEGQQILPLDIHIDGVSAENATPIQVCLGKILPNGLNIGNVTLYHVEDGVANAMTQVMTLAELDTHNEFYYDPITGDITVAMATFSEVTVVSQTEKPWQGVIAEAFADGEGTEEDPYIIANADQLAYMSKAVSTDEAYADAHYKLISDINLNGETARVNDDKTLIFYPIGYWAEQEGTNSAGETYYGAGNSFTGVFDGNGNTIANIYQNTWLMDGNYDNGYWNTVMGLFGALWSAEMKNLTIDNFQSDGEFTPTGCIAAYAGGPDMLFENIYLTNCNPRVYNTGNGGLVGLNYNSSSGTADVITFRNVTVDQTNKISALWGSYDVACGGILGRLRENSNHDGTNTDGQKNTVTFENCHVAAIMDVYNDVCANYQYYQYRYAGMFIGTVDYVGDVPNVGVEDVVFAADCTYTYGDWNEYWYCELVKNSLASYTHDHQFSRLTKITGISDIQDENGNWNTEGSFVLPNEDNTAAECYHIFKDSEGNLYQHFHDVADESNPEIYETTDIDGDGELNDLKEDCQRYYIPFGQLWTGYGWGSSPSYNADAYENIGITLREDGLVNSESKFEAKTVDSITQGTTVRLSDLVTLAVDETKLSKSTLAVFVSPVITETTTSTVTADVSINTGDWGESTLTFSGIGAAKIVITDYFYCTPTEIYVTVGEQVAVDKFQAKSDLTFNEATVSLGDIFEEIENPEVAVDDATVTVSAVDAEGNSVATAEYDTTTWENGTLTFNGYTGDVTVTIQDGNRCNVFTTTITLENAVKFTANSVDPFTAGETITLGQLFTKVEGVTINSATVTVTVSGVEYTYEQNDTDWTQSTIVVNQEAGTAAVTITDNDYCVFAENTFSVEEKNAFAIVLPDANFLYRVGNANELPLNKLFEITDATTINGDITVTATSLLDNTTMVVSVSTTKDTLSSANLWSSVSYTGPAVLTIDALGANAVTLNVEVVAAYNRTSASFSGNSVLLNDVSTSTTLSTSGVIYGNGFTVNMENAPVSEKNGAVFHLYDGAILKNLNIVGKEYTKVVTTVNDTDYGVSAVRAWGTVVIENCYISGCRAAVSVTGTELTIKDSIIANGVYANIDFRSGILNLHNVTTINEPHTVDGTTIVGLGIVGNMTASAGRQINITGTLTQHNWVSQADCENIKTSGVDSIFESVFTDDTYAAFRYTYNGTTYANTGILSLCSDFGASAANGVPSNYAGKSVTATIGTVTSDGYVWAPGQAGTLTAEDMKYHGVACTPVSGNQGTSYIPSDFNYDAAGLTQENGVVQISYESGASYTLSNETLKTLFTAQKYGQELPYTITMNGADYTDSDIVFDATASQTYTITYTVTDNLVYGEDGALTGETYKVTKDLTVFATVVDKGADAPTFTFYYGTNGSASAGTPHTPQPTNNYTGTIKQVGEAYYIMPNVDAASANAIGSTTVDSETIYYPIVDGINVRSGNSTDYDFTRYYPIFKAVTISDNGTEYSYSGTTEMPATVTWVSATIDTGNGASALNDGFGLYNSQYLCKIQTKAGNAESGGTSVVQFSYVALDGNTYNYYVGFRFYDEDEGGTCVTGDTLITLADGSQVRIDTLTGSEQLLVWNHTTGSLEAVPVAYIVDHGKEIDQQEIYHLYFSDGSELKIINEHVFYDATLNKYVTLDENAADYIGHTFVGLSDSNDALTSVQLVDVVTEYEETTIYEVVSYEHLTCFTNGILSASAYIDKLLNIFDIVPETMAYDPEKVQADIETYGLYTYADFEGLIDEAAFELYNAKYLKIAVGKGYITWDDILDLIDIYFNVGVTPLQ